MYTLEVTRESGTSVSPDSLGPYAMLLSRIDPVPSELTRDTEIFHFEPVNAFNLL